MSVDGVFTMQGLMVDGLYSEMRHRLNIILYEVRSVCTISKEVLD